ncbi:MULTISPECIES: hypothetical protein [unclassified Mesorhizobium]|uniref:hypothetical protein n=1 Tax=unclassified Mesorhizobium TaxID=325217 RepID=UPI00112B0EF1|nr:MULTISPECIES: hypothetical protein [unclassified Mesorhizobium]TPJ38183.1 hypothetical protein FJ437_30875 [Mesorhizobium sp. B2-6-6]MCA0000954.1 hypothetical protein [Mesorhizobium sp. B264B2A]MCA0004703.1 hypothetical protein [Mesorhizobium sp. B264B1B]MCA0019098.1 hypothetical protein [Mesorhizobium sp. B264B1A]TPJ56019.1 hypothetical protein FJ462_32810 [Mesorhizobium sp. B2-6-7]
MSVEDLNNAAAADLNNGAVAISEDEALGALYDEAEQEDDAGPTRDQGGKFTAADGKTAADNASLEGEGKGEAGDDAAGSTLAASVVPLPANWNGMDADWAKIPPDVQAKIAARDTDIHKRMSDQGRQLTAFQPIAESIERNKDLLAGKTTPDGRPFTAPAAIDALLNAQRRLETNPVAGLLEIAQRFGVIEQIAQVLAGQAKVPADRQTAALGAADVERIVREKMNESATASAMEAELSRLSKDKPLYSEIPEEDMVHSISKARAKLGDSASPEALFDLAYDIAVNADPDLRTKAASLKTAAAHDPKRTADAKRANSVNVTSKSTGKSRELTEDEKLSALYDEIQSKG